MKILIIGKTGQVGLSLIAEAQSREIQYRATDREILNITDANAVNDFFDHNHHYDFIINAAAYTNVDAAENDQASAHNANSLAVEYLATAAKKYDIPFIHISTDYVFDGEKKVAYTEEDEVNPQNYYGKTKLAGERALQATWEKHIIIRVSWVISEYGKNFLKTISALCDQKEILSVVGDQLGSPTSARSIATVILTICEKLYTEKIILSILVFIIIVIFRQVTGIS